MTDAPPPADIAPRLPAPLRRARGVAMTAGLLMTPLLIAAGLWADRASPAGARGAQAMATSALRPTIAPDAGRR